GVRRRDVLERPPAPGAEVALRQARLDRIDAQPRRLGGLDAPRRRGAQDLEPRRHLEARRGFTAARVQPLVEREPERARGAPRGMAYEEQPPHAATAGCIFDIPPRDMASRALKGSRRTSSWLPGRRPGHSGATAPDSHRVPRAAALT